MKNRINLSALTAHAATACGTPHTHSHTKNEGLVTSVRVFSSTASQKALCNISAYVNFFTTSTWRRETTTTTTPPTMTTRRHHQRLNLTRSACPRPACRTVPDRSHSASCHCQFWLPVFVTALLCLLCSLCLSNCLSVCHWVCLFKCNIYFMDCCYIFSSTFNPKTERINFPSISIHRRSRGRGCRRGSWSRSSAV